MRGTIAKRLRRITQYDPNNNSLNKYVERSVFKRAAVPVEVNKTGFIMVTRTTLLLAGAVHRAKYQRAKALYRQNKATFSKAVWQVGI